MDIVFMALALRGIWVGTKRGILGELILTAGLLASIAMALFISSPTGSVLANQLSFGIQFTTQFLSWLVLGAGFIVSLIIAKVVQKLSHLIIQSPIDKGAGGVLGGARAILLSGILLSFVLHSGQLFFQEHAKESIIGSFVIPKVDVLYEIVKQKITPTELVKLQDELTVESDQEAVQEPSQDISEPSEETQ